MHKIVVKRILRYFFSLIIGGGIIGLLHPYDILVAVLLTALLAYKLSVEFRKESSSSKVRLLVFGVLIQAICGVLIELWGIHNDYWTYHNLPSNRDFPLWLPTAWGFTFLYFYRFEKGLFENIPNLSFTAKLGCVILIYSVYPTFGEMVTINLGVWTYAWGYQLFGVPLLAIVLLTLYHSAVYVVYWGVLRKLKISDPVFNA